MPKEEKLAPIIIIKKKAPHGGHHGGAWKVAYADFVTAMMALFIVLWLLSSSEQTKKAVGGYFTDPSGSGKMMGSSMSGGAGEGLTISKDNMADLRNKIQQAMAALPKFNQVKGQVQMKITSEGLRVELLETPNGMFFESGNALPSSAGKEILVGLAEQMGKLPNNIVIEGHTDSKPFNKGGTYTNWELSTDRANAARRIMEESGLRVNQVKQLRGFADQQLRKPQDPEDAGNRRISIIVQYLKAPPDASEKGQVEHAEQNTH